MTITAKTAKTCIQSAIDSIDWETINAQPADLVATIDTLIRIDGLRLDVVGSCLWITGATATCSRWSIELKEAGFRLGFRAGGEASWIWCPCINSDSSRAG